MNLEAVIGLEVHVHLDTKSKLFCGCENVSEAERPNRFVCPVCMGFPGTLPVLNRQAVEWTILAGLALGCRIPERAMFARKSYFYPDLPKGYQISQYEEPLAVAGSVHLFAGGLDRAVRIRRVHLEEDAAKNVHTAGGVLVDHNRAGTPLIEVVTEPDLRGPEEAKTLLEELQRVMRYLGISRADMEHGDLRVDANISLREPESGDLRPEILHPKTEIKNLNSFRAVERALTYEIERQGSLWEAGTPPTMSSTRGWNAGSGTTLEQREKEGEADYRYFPEPDIPPLAIEPEMVKKLRLALPELPHAKEVRFKEQYGLSPADAHLLVEDRLLADFAEEVFSEVAAWVRDLPDVRKEELPRLFKLATNYLLGDFRTLLLEREATARTSKATAENVAELILMLHRSEVNRNAVREVLRLMHETGGDPSEIVREHGWALVSDAEALRHVVQDVLRGSPAEVDKLRAGKASVAEFFVGQVMARTQGRADPAVVRALLRAELGLSEASNTSSLDTSPE